MAAPEVQAPDPSPSSNRSGRPTSSLSAPPLLPRLQPTTQVSNTRKQTKAVVISNHHQPTQRWPKENGPKLKNKNKNKRAPSRWNTAESAFLDGGLVLLAATS